jgi:hypothetical protein
MNIKNHTGERPFVLSGDQGEEPTFVHSKTFKFFTKDLPRSTGRLANYVLGFFITLDATFAFTGEPEEGLDWDDVARGCFESCELLNTVLGKPISHNYFRGEFFGLFGFIGNGMKRAVPQPPLLPTNTGSRVQRHSWYIPASALLGMKGHHTAQLAVLMDKGTFEVKTAAVGTVSGLTISSGKLDVTAIMVAEPEIRLGPGTQFVRYASTVSPSGTKHQIEALGQTSSLQGVEEGAGIAFLAWMSSRRGYGGSFADAYTMEYLNLPFRGLDQLIHLDAIYADYLGSCGNNDIPPSLTADLEAVNPFAGNGLLYSSAYRGLVYGLRNADFIPLISPKAFLETSKMQSVQGTQDLHAKSSADFDGDDVFVALHYHSWTPAQQEVVLRKIIDSGLAMDVWGTNDLVPSTKIIGKQNALGINPSKTRYFAHTWSPREVQPNPPSQSAKA